MRPSKNNRGEDPMGGGQWAKPIEHLEDLLCEGLPFMQRCFNQFTPTTPRTTAPLSCEVRNLKGSRTDFRRINFIKLLF
jgi:hypothetical protein